MESPFVSPVATRAWGAAERLCRVSIVHNERQTTVKRRVKVA
jgi:hypothetical protein